MPELSLLPTLEGKEAAVDEASRFLVSRLAACEDAIAVALAIARDETVVPQARATALRTIARLMASAATIGTSLARMNGGTRHHVTVERRGQQEDPHKTLSPQESAKMRKKLKTYPRGEGGKKKIPRLDSGEPSKHLHPAYERKPE